MARLRLTVFAIFTIAAISFAVNDAFDFEHTKLIREHYENIGVSNNESPQLTEEHILRDIKARESVETPIQLITFGVLSVLAYFAAGFVLRPIQEQMSERKRFTADAAHDLRTPLSIMKTDLELALRNPDLTREDAHACIESNLEEVDRMTRIIEDLLTLSRVDNSRSEMKFEKMDFGKMVVPIAQEMGKVAAEKEIALKPPERIEPLPMTGNRPALERVLFNLIRNAIEYTPRGGRIEIGARQVGPKIICTVKDTGIGIAKKDLPYIFDRFYKSDTSRLYSAKASGSGLGLAIAKEIVLKHGGKIRLESELGKGTLAIVELPSGLKG